MYALQVRSVVCYEPSPLSTTGYPTKISFISILYSFNYTPLSSGHERTPTPG